MAKFQPDVLNPLVLTCGCLLYGTVAKALHWDLFCQYAFNRGGKWFEHAPESVLENDKVKILWDFTIQKDRKMSHNRPDIVVIDKETNECHTVDVACPIDRRICLKEQEKEEKYIDLAFEIKRLWQLRKVRITPIIIGALGTFSNTYISVWKTCTLDKACNHYRNQYCWDPWRFSEEPWKAKIVCQYVLKGATPMATTVI